MSPPFTASLNAYAVRIGNTESRHDGMIVLTPVGKSPERRVLYVNSYGGTVIWNRIISGNLPAHHLWGCIELVHMGYEVALAEPLNDFYYRRNPLPRDLRFLATVRSWLGKVGIVYCGHNVLHWLPLLRSVGFLRCQTVSLLFGRELLDFCKIPQRHRCTEWRRRRTFQTARSAHIRGATRLGRHPRCLPLHPLPTGNAARLRPVATGFTTLSAFFDRL